MIRALILLIVSPCLTVKAAAPFFFSPKTNDLVAIPVTPNKGRLTSFLAGKTTTNTIYFGGPFWFNTNSTAAVDLEDIFPSLDGGRWERLKIGPRSLGSGTPSVTAYLRGDGTWQTFAAGANPTATIGLSAVNGGATTFLRSDGAPALSQSITPVWSGAHRFDGKVGIGISASARSHLLTGGDVTATGAAGHDIWLQGNVIAAADNDVLYGLRLDGLFDAAGFSGVTTWSLYESTGAGIYLGTGNVRVPGLSASEVVFTDANKDLTSTGNISVSHLNSGSGASATTFWRGDATWATPSGSSGANPSASVGLTAVNGVATTYLRSDGAPALSLSIAPTWTGQHTFRADAGIIASSTVAYDSSPKAFVKGDLKFDSGGTFKTLGYLEFGKENATDGNDAGYLSLFTRPNGGSPTERLRLSSSGVILISQVSPVFQMDRLSGTADIYTLFSFANSAKAYIGVSGNTSAFITGSVAGDICLRAEANGILFSGDGGATKHMSMSSGGTVNIASLTASKLVKTDANKNLVSDTTSYDRTLYSKAAVTTVSNTGSPTTLLDAGQGSASIPANSVRAGSVIVLKIGGELGTDAITPSTFTLDFSLGAGSHDVIISPIGGLSAVGWEATATFTFTAIGASGTVKGHSSIRYKTSGTDVVLGNFGDFTSEAINTTGVNAIDIDVTMSVADAQNTITATYGTMQVFNNQ